MLMRDSVVRHHPCSKRRGEITGNQYFSIISSELDPPGVQNDSLSEDAFEDEEKGEIDEVQN
jgi:hypothetical protein